MLKDERIPVTASGINEPPLLRACKEIRDEALPIYYAENSFAIHVTSYNSDVVLNFERRERCKILRRHNISCKFELLLVGSVNWQNLREWLKRLHARELVIGIASEKETLPFGAHGIKARIHIIGSMFRLAFKTQSLPWEDVDALLEDQHKMLAMLNARWH